jgi:hypothetical protein
LHDVLSLRLCYWNGRLLHRLLAPQTILCKVEAPPALPANTVLVKVTARAIWVWDIRRVGIGQPAVTQIATPFDTAVDEHTKGAKC